MFPIARKFEDLKVTIKNGAALSNTIDMRHYANAGYTLPSGWTAASLAFKVSVDGAVFYPLKVAAGTLIEHASPADGRAFPAEALAFPFVKLWSETGGSDVNQTADRTILVALKG